MSVEAHIATSFPDSVQFRAISRRRGIRTLSPRGRVRKENCAAAWRTRRVHAAHLVMADPRSDLFYIR